MWRSSKSQSGEGGVSQEELAGSGWSCGEAETEEKSMDVVSESKGQASAQPPPSPWAEAGEGSRSMGWVGRRDLAADGASVIGRRRRARTGSGGYRRRRRRKRRSRRRRRDGRRTGRWGSGGGVRRGAMWGWEEGSNVPVGKKVVVDRNRIMPCLCLPPSTTGVGPPRFSARGLPESTQVRCKLLIVGG